MVAGRTRRRRREPELVTKGESMRTCSLLDKALVEVSTVEMESIEAEIWPGCIGKWGGKESYTNTKFCRLYRPVSRYFPICQAMLAPGPDSQAGVAGDTTTESVRVNVPMPCDTANWCSTAEF
jgi:hypothetical protein